MINLIIMGQDVAGYGGVFKITEGLCCINLEETRVRNTPICESAIVSAAYGASLNGMKAVMEMQFADFVSSGFNPIVNLLAKSNYRWNQNADVVDKDALWSRSRCWSFSQSNKRSMVYQNTRIKSYIPRFSRRC